jgi:hypothetical protein
MLTERRPPTTLAYPTWLDRLAATTPARGERTLFVNLRSFAGAAALTFLLPVVVLAIGVPLALAVRFVLEALTWLPESTG